MKRNLLVLLCFTLNFAIAQSTSLATSSALQTGEAEREGMSPERISKIDQMLKEAVTENQIPGTVALIARNGKIIFHKAYGVSRLIVHSSKYHLTKFPTGLISSSSLSLLH